MLLGGAGLVEVERLGQRLLGDRPQRPDVVDHVERPPMGGDHQVELPRLDREPHHRRGRHAVRPLHPPPAAVVGDPEAELGAEEEEIPVPRVLLHDVGVAAQVRGRQALPGLAVVGGAVDVGLEVRPPVVVEDHERRAGVEPGGEDVGDPGVRRHSGDVLLDARPGLAAVARHLQAAVVRPHPDHPLLHRARGDGEDGRVVLGVAGVGGDAAALRRRAASRGCWSSGPG